MTTQETDKTVWLITGTSSGLGRRLVEVVQERGDLAIATARDLNQIEYLKSPTCAILQLDVTNSPEHLKETAAQAVSIWGRVDVLVNNAGWGAPGLSEEIGVDGYMHTMQINFFGVINVTNAFLPYMREKRSGTVVIIGSRSAWTPDVPMISSYAASKAAIHAYGESLATELAQFNIRVLIVQPGGFRTEGISKNAHIIQKVDDYNQLREIVLSRFSRIQESQKGDPRKAMEAVFDVVKGENAAKGRAWPLRLALGEEAEVDIRKQCERIIQNLDDWKDVIVDPSLRLKD